MSNLCFCICAIVIYCAVLYNQIGETACDKDFSLSNIKQFSGENALLKLHPFLRHKMLSNNMISLLNGLKRRKRVSHHGLKKKYRRIPSVKEINRQHNFRLRNTPRTPLFDINDVESPMYEKNKMFRRKRIPHHRSMKKNRKILPQENSMPSTARSIYTETRDSEKHFESSVETTSNIIRHMIFQDYIDYENSMNKPLSIIRRDTAFETYAKSTSQNTNDSDTNSSISTTNSRLDKLLKMNPFLLNLTRQASKRDVVFDTVAKAMNLNGVGQNPVIGTGSHVAALAASDPNAGDPGSTSTVCTTGSVSSESSLVAETTTQLTTLQNLGSLTDTGETTSGTTLIGSVSLPSPIGGATNNASCERELPCHMGDTLDQILETVEMLTHDKGKGGSHEDFPCEVNGSWISEAGGVRLDITLNNNQLNIVQEDSVPKKPHKGFLCNDTWELNGTLPLPKTGIIMITGVNAHDKRVASFIGECKVYANVHLIWGHWIVGETTKDNIEGLMAQQIYTDVLVQIKVFPKSSTCTTPSTTRQVIPLTNATCNISTATTCAVLNKTTCFTVPVAQSTTVSPTYTTLSSTKIQNTATNTMCNTTENTTTTICSTTPITIPTTTCAPATTTAIPTTACNTTTTTTTIPTTTCNTTTTTITIPTTTCNSNTSITLPSTESTSISTITTTTPIDTTTTTCIDTSTTTAATNECTNTSTIKPVEQTVCVMVTDAVTSTVRSAISFTPFNLAKCEEDYLAHLTPVIPNNEWMPVVAVPTTQLTTYAPVASKTQYSNFSTYVFETSTEYGTYAPITAADSLTLTSATEFLQYPSVLPSTSTEYMKYPPYLLLLPTTETLIGGTTECQTLTSFVSSQTVRPLSSIYTTSCQPPTQQNNTKVETQLVKPEQSITTPKPLSLTTNNNSNCNTDFPMINV